jgi:hypothetical protein
LPSVNSLKTSIPSEDAAKKPKIKIFLATTPFIDGQSTTILSPNKEVRED